MLQTAQALIKADRTGCWQMHLRAILDCLSVFAAAGHYNYLKSAYFYLQEMCQLETKHPDVHEKFSRGFHVIRHSNQYWAGLSSDLVIEQTLMRSLKSSGGLTHGRGFSEEMRALWTMSTPITCENNNVLQEFNNLTYMTSEQHQESSEARMKRDHSEKIKEKLCICTPFSPDPSLRNIVNGVVANEEVNVHEFETVGNEIIEKIIGKSVFGITFKRKDRAKTLADNFTIKVANDRTIDPALLFQRFLIMSKTRLFSLEEVMIYELCSFLAVLFEARASSVKPTNPSWHRQSLISQLRNPAKLSSIPSPKLSIMSLMVAPWFIACHGKRVTVTGPLHSHMQTLPYAFMVKQQSFLMVIVNVLLSKTIRIRDVGKTLTPSLTSMQRLCLWGEKTISFPDLATNKDLLPRTYCYQCIG